MVYSSIEATASYLPRNIVTNDDLAKFIDTSDSWIKERTGISQRHVVAPGDDSATMAIAAAKKMIEDHNIDSSEIDMILVASCTSTKIIPSIACRVQGELGLVGIPAFDINAACSGFLYALATADSFIKTGFCKKILLIGTDTMSQIVDWEDRSTCVLFGDGAGAVLIGSSSTPGLMHVNLGADGTSADILSTSGNLISAAEPPFINMNGKEVYKKAVTNMASVSKQIIEDSGIDINDLDWLIPHQANKRIIESTAKSLSLPMEKVILTLSHHANTSAASIPLALDDAIRSEKLKRGDNILMSAFGAGLTWAGALLTY